MVGRAPIPGYSCEEAKLSSMTLYLNQQNRSIDSNDVKKEGETRALMSVIGDNEYQHLDDGVNTAEFCLMSND